MKTRIAKKIVRPLLVALYIDDEKMARKEASRSPKRWRIKVALMMMKHMGDKGGKEDFRLNMAMDKICRRARRTKPQLEEL